MLKKIAVLAIVCVFISPTLLAAQVKKQETLNMAQALTKSAAPGSVLGFLGFNPNRFSMSHSYTLSFANIGGRSFSQGLYLNTMSYQFSNPLTMYLQLGVAHQPFGNLGNEFDPENQVFVSGAGLEYKPSENFKFQVEFSQTPGAYYSPYAPYRYRNPFNAYGTSESTQQDH